MVLDFSTVSTLRSSADAVRVRRHMGRPNGTAAAVLLGAVRWLEVGVGKRNTGSPSLNLPQ